MYTHLHCSHCIFLIKGHNIFHARYGVWTSLVSLLYIHARAHISQLFPSHWRKLKTLTDREDMSDPNKQVDMSDPNKQVPWPNKGHGHPSSSFADLPPARWPVKKKIIQAAFRFSSSNSSSSEKKVKEED